MWHVKQCIIAMTKRTVYSYLLGKGRLCFGSIGLPVRMSTVCEQNYSNSHEGIGLKFSGGVLGGTLTNGLKFGDDLSILR